MGDNGATGLNYAGVRARLLDLVPNRRKRAQVWECIEACEQEQLAIWAEVRAEADAARSNRSPTF